MIIAHIPEGARVLDVGCGTGAGSMLIRDARGAEVVGLEPDPIRAIKAESRGICVVNALFTSEAVSGLGRFDVVVFSDVLEHLVNPGPALLTAKGLLAAKGRVVSSVPNVAHWTVRFDLLFGHFSYREYGIRDATHLRWFDKQGMLKLYEETGYNVVSYAVTAGVDLPEYGELLPWRWKIGRAHV